MANGSFDLRQRQGGTALMQALQTIGIDLPLKALVWQDALGTTWLPYNDPAWLAHRHGPDEEARAVVGAMTAALNALATKATTPRTPTARITNAVHGTFGLRQF
jgi:hypothetical protein